MHAPHQQTHLTHDPNFNLDDTRHQPTSQAIDTTHMNHTHIGWADQDINHLPQTLPKH